MSRLEIFSQMKNLIPTDDPEDTMGYCPECGSEIQRRDSCTVRITVNVTPGPGLTSGYRCPNAMFGRNDTSPSGYCKPSHKDKSEWVYQSLDQEVEE